jgi:hypothetical protein
MSITIPTWLLYAIGGVAALGVLLLAALGVLFIVALWNWRPY